MEKGGKRAVDKNVDWKFPVDKFVDWEFPVDIFVDWEFPVDIFVDWEFPVDIFVDWEFPVDNFVDWIFWVNKIERKDERDIKNAKIVGNIENSERKIYGYWVKTIALTYTWYPIWTLLLIKFKFQYIRNP